MTVLAHPADHRHVGHARRFHPGNILFNDADFRISRAALSAAGFAIVFALTPVAKFAAIAKGVAPAKVEKYYLWLAKKTGRPGPDLTYNDGVFRLGRAPLAEIRTARSVLIKIKNYPEAYLEKF